MSSFTTPLQAEDQDDGRRRILVPFIYHATTYPSDETYIVPAGFVSDGASIPRLLWPLLGHPWAHPHGKAAVLHDYLYATALVTRARADVLFAEALEVLGVGRLKRALLYAGVRAGGWRAWRRHRDRPPP